MSPAPARKSAARALLAVACAALALAPAGCESTQSKSDRLMAQVGKSANEQGLRIAKVSRDVKVRATDLLSDPSGTAAVVELHNVSKRTLVDVPIAIEVLQGKRAVFANDTPGLAASLVGVGALRPGESLAWVNDQVFAKGSKLDVKVGATKAKPPARLPRIEVGPARLGGDPTSGVAAEGKVVNRSGIVQEDLVIYAVARKGGRVVAAGRGLVERLKPGRPAGYQVFFIGNPEGARLELAAPPTTFQ